MAVADPVAQAMSALHRIEATNGAAAYEAAPAALNYVRQALALLQAQQVAHPAVEQGMAAIAGSLGVVHQLAQAAVAPQAPAAAPAVSPYAGTMMQAEPAIAPPQVAPPQPRPQPAPVQAQPPAAHAGAVAYAGNYAPPQAAPPQAAPAPAQVRPGAHAPAPGSRVEAALGAHSPTNFYKGLSGNDVIESGGIFIATYQIPPIGTNLVIHVSLPGGYEFEGQAVVRWTREAPNSAGGGAEAPPGFGAQFLNITPEGRQLVYRYVRNREPLFHDDL
ncbi:MAG: PilZ domain-containing protein [Polyangiaceae bacterium]